MDFEKEKSMTELFECSSDNISLHLKNIYKDKELIEDSTTEFFSIVQKEETRNVRRNAKCYNLDAIITVDYRVNSKKAFIFAVTGQTTPEIIPSRADSHKEHMELTTWKALFTLMILFQSINSFIYVLMN